jgi:hypothetical protein
MAVYSSQQWRETMIILNAPDHSKMIVEQLMELNTNLENITSAIGDIFWGITILCILWIVLNVPIGRSSR